MSMLNQALQRNSENIEWVERAGGIDVVLTRLLSAVRDRAYNDEDDRWEEIRQAVQHAADLVCRTLD